MSRPITDPTPIYSVPLGYWMPDPEDAGISRGLNVPTGFKGAGAYDSPIFRDLRTLGNIRLDSVLPGD